MLVSVREKKAIFVLVVGILLSVASFVQGWIKENNKWEESFLTTVREYQIIFNNRIKSNKELLESIVYLFRASDHVTREEFRVFTTPIINKNLYIQALEWTPFVESSERRSYELEASLFDEVKDFKFKEFHGATTQVSKEKPFYFPVYYLEPLRGNEKAFGIDLHSDSLRRDALEKAWRNGYFQATSKIKLVQEGEEQAGFLIFAPVYKGDIGNTRASPETDILGFVVGVYRVGDMLNKTFLPILKKGIGLSVYDGDTLDQDSLIYSAGETGSLFSRKKTVLVEGRVWTLVWTANSQFGSGLRMKTVLTTFFVLISFTLFISFIVNMISSRANEIEKLVKKRTDELSSAQKAIEEHKIQRLEEAKFVALGEMASSIAHEINNPLAIIYSKSRQILKRLSDGKYTQDDVIRSVTKIADTSTRISKIVSGLSHISGDAAKETFDETSLLDVCNKTVNLCREKFKNNGIELVEDYPEKDIFVAGKSIQLGQVLLNLLNNAFDALENNDTQRVRVSLSENTTNAIISVKDSGPGVNSEHINRLFDPFFTTKPLGKGTGLGLSISQRIIKEHNGHIKCLVEDGTEFIIELPKV